MNNKIKKAIQQKGLIKVGDEVILNYADEKFEVTVLNMPRGVGDLLQVKIKEGGNVMAIHPYCPEFKGLIKLDSIIKEE